MDLMKRGISITQTHYIIPTANSSSHGILTAEIGQN